MIARLAAVAVAAPPTFVDARPQAPEERDGQVLTRDFLDKIPAGRSYQMRVSGRVCDEVAPANLGMRWPGHWLLTRSTARHRVFGLRRVLTDCPATPEGDGVLELVPTRHSLAGALELVPGVAPGLTVAGRPLEYVIDGARLLP